MSIPSENNGGFGFRILKNLEQLIIPTSCRSLHPDVLKSENRNVLLVASTLIAIVTFRAGVTPPGGCWQQTDEKEGIYAGRAIFSAEKVPFHVFLIFNTLAFISSIFLLLLLTSGFPFFLEVFIASVSMVITYASAVYAVTPSENVQFRLIFMSAAALMLVRLLISLICRQINRIFKTTNISG
ncbi:hypothetical protein L1049_021575 [Liquidambar formosana]|uniref:PGG domain-containing protein n=1 Tax=Liquidambar formosana TaxID=63359 RepID=A0AAP0R220_LIQFO